MTKKLNKKDVERQIADLQKQLEDIKHKYRFQHIHSYDKPEYERLEKEIIAGIAKAKSSLRYL
jgi:hypothetical protein